MIKQLIKLIWNRRRSNAFIILEILAAFLVLVGVSTFGLHYWHLLRQPLGFSYENVWSIFAYEEGVVNGSAGRIEVLQLIVHKLKEFNEVKAIGQSQYNLYGTGKDSGRFNYQGRYVLSRSTIITDGCGDVLQPDLIQGSWFGRSDDDSEYPPVIINKRFGDELFGSENPLGKLIEVPGGYKEMIGWYKVVGVVSDFRFYGEYDRLRPFVLYRTTLTNPDNFPGSTLLIRVDPSTAVTFKAKMLAEFQRLAPSWTFRIIPVAMIREKVLQEGFDKYFSLGLVAFFLMVMVALGLTGILWQNVTRRTREFGLRRAAGAPVRRVFQQIAGEILVITTTAVILGIFLIPHFLLLDIAPYVRGQAYIWGTAIAVGIIYFLTIVCTLYPGYLATRIHPAEALHYE